MVVACLAGEGTMAMLLLLCSALERRVSERDSESEREREGEWRAVCSPFWRGRVGQRRCMAATRRARPAHGRPLPASLKSTKCRFRQSNEPTLHLYISKSSLSEQKVH